MSDHDVWSARQWELESPDTRVRLQVWLDEAGSLHYSVDREGNVFLADSGLGLVTDNERFAEGLAFSRIETAVIDETYELPHGKTSRYANRANELTVHLEKNGRPLHIAFRAYNDGIAYRYVVPGDGALKIASDLSTFTLPRTELINVWAQKWMWCYERTYDLYMLEHLGGGDYAFPMLFQLGRNGWLLLTEAAVYGEACACHVKADPLDMHTLQLAFAPDQTDPVRASLPYASPWRVAILGDRLAAIVESALVFHLNPPSEIADVSWIKPGRVAWSWYSEGKTCGDLATQQRFVDFAAEMGWEYSLADGGWEEQLDVPALVAYAKPRGIGIWLWSHYRNLREEEACRRKFALWAGWGVKGVKVDFFDSDSQERLKTYDMIARVAMEHRLMINYHGSTKPSGEQRRWPHVLTREGIFGAEYWRGASEGPNAAHNCTVPFTRNAIGSMDYTPVTFSKPTRTSCAHQTALAIVFESAAQHFADSIEAYRESAALPLLKEIPAAWDETRLLSGYPGRFVAIARRKGGDWYIGAICAAGGTVLNVSLDFLTPGAVYRADIGEDVLDGDKEYRYRPGEMRMRSLTATCRDMLELPLKVNGGCAVRLAKIARENLSDDEVGR